MAVIGLTPAQQAAAILHAAYTYGVPQEVLLGIYGVETSFGSNVTTSSTGAMGPFQFEPATAATYNYPLTNTPTAAQFQQQADAAAQFLKALHSQLPGGGTAANSNWTNAIAAYYAGAGGYQSSAAQAYANHVGQLANQLPSALKAAIDSDNTPALADSPVTAVTNAVSTTGDALAAIGKFLAALTQPRTWLRVAEGIAGLLLLMTALRQFASVAGGSSALVGPKVPAPKVIPV